MHGLSDWPSERNLLEVFVSMSCSGGMSDALKEMKALRNRTLRDTREEVELRTAFLRTNGAAFRMWLLQSSHFLPCCKTTTDVAQLPGQVLRLVPNRNPRNVQFWTALSAHIRRPTLENVNFPVPDFHEERCACTFATSSRSFFLYK